ncbi:MAG: hypothetical protein KFB97_09660 [Cyanobium sp. M30B3]|nr:MAG: hypothetical protein KFB97_09660 [Cyanobium sp. M30B3]
MRTTQAEFERIARRVISFIEDKHAPVPLNEIEQFFAHEKLSISVGRVILQLLADRKLYLTEDRKVMVASQQMALA